MSYDQTVADLLRENDALKAAIASSTEGAGAALVCEMLVNAQEELRRVKAYLYYAYQEGAADFTPGGHVDPYHLAIKWEASSARAAAIAESLTALGSGGMTAAAVVG